MIALACICAGNKAASRKFPSRYNLIQASTPYKIHYSQIAAPPQTRLAEDQCGNEHALPALRSQHHAGRANARGHRAPAMPEVQRYVRAWKWGWSAYPNKLSRGKTHAQWLSALHVYSFIFTG